MMHDEITMQARITGGLVVIASTTSCVVARYYFSRKNLVPFCEEDWALILKHQTLRSNVKARTESLNRFMK